MNKEQQDKWFDNVQQLILERIPLVASEREYFLKGLKELYIKFDEIDKKLESGEG